MKRTLIVTAAVVILICGVIWIWSRASEPSRPSPSMAAPSAKPAAQSQKSSALPKGKSPVPVELTDEMFDKLATEIAETIKPNVWKRPEFDGQSDRLTSEQLAKVKAIAARHFSNFQRIGSLQMRATQTISALVDNKEANGYVKARQMADNYDLEITGTRNPQHFAMRGRMGNDNSVREVITPAGKLSSGHVGFGESFIPAYLEGEQYFLELTLLKCGSSVQEGVPWTLPAPSQEFDSFLNSQPQARYSVIKNLNQGDGLMESYWFNEQSGLLERVTIHNLDDQGRPKQMTAMTAIEYAPYNGVPYVKRSLTYGIKMQVRCEYTTHDVKIRPLDTTR